MLKDEIMSHYWDEYLRHFRTSSSHEVKDTEVADVEERIMLKNAPSPRHAQVNPTLLLYRQPSNWWFFSTIRTSIDSLCWIIVCVLLNWLFLLTSCWDRGHTKGFCVWDFPRMTSADGVYPNYSETFVIRTRATRS